MSLSCEAAAAPPVRLWRPPAARWQPRAADSPAASPPTTPTAAAAVEMPLKKQTENQTDTNEIATMETKYQTDSYSSEKNTNI